MAREEEEVDQGRYDVFSPSLDPSLVLLWASEDQVINLDRNERPLDSLYKARYILPEGDPDRLVKRTREEVSEDDDDDEDASGNVRTTVLNVPLALPGKSVSQSKASKPRAEGPFESIAAGFAEGPMSVLKESLNRVVRVKVRRRAGVTSWCTGRLLGFDRHFNLLLMNVTERYSVKEEIWVSARPKTQKDKLVQFLQVFDASSDEDYEQKVERLIVEFGSNESGMWKHLQEKHGIRARVEALEKVRNVDALLKRWSGHERQLLMHLEARARGDQKPSPAKSALWVRLPSEKYPGHFFYTNNHSGESVWEAPAGVSFRSVLAFVPRVKPFPQMIVRGDAVLLVCKAQDGGQSSSSIALATGDKA